MSSEEHVARGERLATLLESFPQRKVLVVGDLVADQFLYGEISRVSREAPVLILRHERTETIPGAAANAAANLASLGARAVILGVAGEDESGRALLERLRGCGVECSGIVTLPAHRTTTKVRILAGQPHSTRQQVIRVDYDGETSFQREVRQNLLARIHEEIQDADAVIISDYNYGVVDGTIAARASPADLPGCSGARGELRGSVAAGERAGASSAAGRAAGAGAGEGQAPCPRGRARRL